MDERDYKAMNEELNNNKMKKLIGFETIIVTEGIKMFSELIKEDIKKATSEGKVHMFSEEYIDLMTVDIKKKLKLN
jgi:hypothetical protein